VLLSFFHPIVTRLRGLPHPTELGKVQRALGGSRPSLGALAEAATVCDAARLTGLIDALGAPRPPRQSDPHWHDSTRTIPLVDGPRWPARPQLVQAVGLAEHPKACKLHCPCEWLTGVPVRAHPLDAD
jgi:hypothetical protein